MSSLRLQQDDPERHREAVVTGGENGIGRSRQRPRVAIVAADLDGDNAQALEFRSMSVAGRATLTGAAHNA